MLPTKATDVLRNGGFKPLPVALIDPQQLPDYQEFDNMIFLTKERMLHYDLTGVFVVVFPDATGSLMMDFPAMCRLSTSSPTTRKLRCAT
jgi:hypothetical protein